MWSFLLILFSFVPLGLWISALASGVHVSIFTLVGMRIRRIQPQRLVHPLIKANKAGLDVTISKLETHFLAGGNIDRIILTGGIAHSQYVTTYLTDKLSFIAPIEVMAGEFEMEALAAGACRVLSGEEIPHTFGELVC